MQGGKCPEEYSRPHGARGAHQRPPLKLVGPEQEATPAMTGTPRKTEMALRTGSGSPVVSPIWEETIPSLQLFFDKNFPQKTRELPEMVPNSLRCLLLAGCLADAQ